MIPGNANPLLLASAAADGAAAGVATKSLRFNSGDSAFLSRTPSSAGNRKKFTFSAWVKKSTITDSQRVIFSAYGGTGNAYVSIDFRHDSPRFLGWDGSSVTFEVKATRVLRDPSAWYHIIWAVDTNQSTAANRAKLYINGVEETDFQTASYPSQNSDLYVNTTNVHKVGENAGTNSAELDAYLADVFFIDGSQLDESSFGAFNDNGVWQAAVYSGTYGTNGFHLDFADSSDLGDDNSGNGNDFTPNNLSGTGAATSSAAVLNLPLNSTPFSDSSASSATVTNTGSVSTASAGTNSFNISNAASLDGSSQRLTTNNNNISFQGSWTIDVYFKIDSGASDGQGLFNSGYGSQTSHYMYIAIDSSDRPFIETSSSGSRSTASAISKNVWYHMRVIQKSGTITMYINGTSVVTHTAQTTDLSTAGSRTIGSLLDNANNQNNFDGLVGPFRIINDALDAPSSGGEATSSGTLANTGSKTVGADIDSLFDVPTNDTTNTDSGVGGEVSGNYATLNPLNKHNSANTLVNGNLEFTTTGNNAGICESTIAMSSGKFYFEVVFSGGQGTGQLAGIRKPGARNYDDSFIYVGTGNKYTNGGSGASYGASLSNGDIIGTAFDATNGTLTFYKNGVSQGQAFSGISGAYSFIAGSFGSSPAYIVNFGQRPFAYAAPSGFKALNTANLSTPTIADGSDYFQTALWTGNGGTQSITTTGMSPGFVWIKKRSGTTHHNLFDIVRGANKPLFSSLTNAELSDGRLTAFNSNGFTLDSDNAVNDNNQTHVGWAWDGGNLVTNSAYNQADVWSDRLSGTILSSSLGYKNAFDGDTSTATHPANGNTITFTPSTAISVSSSIKIYFQIGSITGISGTADITINGTSYVSNANAGRSNGHFTVTGVSSITSITWERAADNDLVVVTAIEVDSKKLVDAGVIPADSVSSGVPSIASTVRANLAAGFSIVSFNLSVTNTEKSIGHGLNTAPTFFIIKNRSSAENWYVYTTAIDGTLDFRYLNSTEAFSASSRTLPTSSVFYFASPTTGDHIAYCFAPVEGYSAIGTYTGNGASGYPDADGPFIYLGFRPAWVLWKCQSQVENWTIYDTARGPFNWIDNKLLANSSAAESTNANHEIDFLSNGFKVRNNNGEFNQNNGTYLYVAFAENPFQANGGLAR